MQADVDLRPTLMESRVLEAAEYVRAVLGPLVDHPETLTIEHALGRQSCVLTVSCCRSDFGQLVGKEHRNLRAIRELLLGIGGRHSIRYELECRDPQKGAGKLR